MRDEIDRYLARCEAAGLAFHTRRGYRSRLYHFAESCPLAATDIGSEDIEDYLDVALAGMKLSSKRTALSALSAFFTYLQRRGRVRVNPCDGAKLASRPRPRPTYYSPDAAARLIAAGNSPRNRLITALALRHGQRAGAIIRLRWEAVDWNAAHVNYPPWKNRPGLRLPLDTGLARSLRA